MTENERYKTTGKLSSHPHILCTGCGDKVTAFGKNLDNKIVKAGGVQELIDTFKCKSCKAVSQGKAPIPKVKKERKPRQSKASAREKRVAEMIASAPKFNSAPPQSIILVDNPKVAADTTRNGCWRPDIFLNNDRTCDFCSLYNVCASPNRKVSKRGWRAEAAS